MTLNTFSISLGAILLGSNLNSVVNKKLNKRDAIQQAKASALEFHWFTNLYVAYYQCYGLH